MFSRLEQHLLPCAYKSIFGFDCPTCGCQRAFICLLKGEFFQSLRIYPPLIPVLALLVLAVGFLVNKQVVKQAWLQRYALMVLALVTVNFLYNLTRHL